MLEFPNHSQNTGSLVKQILEDLCKFAQRLNEFVLIYLHQFHCSHPSPLKRILIMVEYMYKKFIQNSSRQLIFQFP